MVPLLLIGCVAMAGVRSFALPLHIHPQQWPASNWTDRWYGPEQYGTPRAALQARLEQLPGKQLVIVRYAFIHEALNEWVYNEPDIDAAKVIWARGMSYSEDLDLIRYYKDRQVWLVDPDEAKPALQAYTMAGVEIPYTAKPCVRDVQSPRPCDFLPAQSMSGTDSASSPVPPKSASLLNAGVANLDR